MIRYSVLLLALVLLPVVTARGRGKSCTSDDDCDGKLSCLGRKKMRCAMKKGRGMKCGGDPFWVCQDDLVCEDEICKVPVAGECTKPGSICVDGVECVGNDTFQCFMPKREGMKCGLDPFWVCRKDLVCEKRICKTPIGGDCSVRKARCVRGSACIDGMCMKVVGKGKRCGSKRICKERFVCAGESRETSVCVIPGKPGRKCGSFDTCRDSTCVDGRCVV